MYNEVGDVMHEIIEKTFELLDVIDDSEVMKKFLVYKEKLLGNEEILDLIKRGNEASSLSCLGEIKKEIYDNEDYRGYIDCYNKLYFLVYEMNSRFKELLDVKECMVNNEDY